MERGWTLTRLGRGRDGGFTFVELLVVMVIIGILASIGIAVFLGQREKAGDAAAKSDLRNLVLAEVAHAVQTGGYTTDFGALRAEGFSGTPSVTVGVCTYGPSGDDEFVAVARDSRSETPFYYNSGTGEITEIHNPLGTCTP